MEKNNRLETRASADGFCFYIDGSLQFDTRDEFIYHESLVLPAASILTARKHGVFNALVLGGGDGLALRELLKYDRLQQVHLVDYDAGVIECAKTQFAPWNKNSLSDPRVTIFTAEASQYLKTSHKKYDLIIIDFTFPDRLESCRVFTEGFYSLIKHRLSSNGILALNSISPDLSAPAYWSIFKTLGNLDLNPKPLKASIPSFASHGYGNWGFFFCSHKPITERELSHIAIDVPVKYLDKEIFRNGMKFKRTAVALGLSFSKILKEPSDLLCLLNTRLNLSGGNDFILDFSSPLVKEELKSFDISHNMMASLVTPEWRDKITVILKSLNWAALLAEIKKHLGGMSAALKKEFNSLKKEINALLREKVFQWDRVAKVMSSLLLLVVFVNLLYPDNVFAKGYYNSNSNGDTQELFIFSPTQRAAFYTLPFGLLVSSSLFNTQTPDPAVSYVDSDGSVKNENFFFALTDELYISPMGRIYLVIPKLHQYEYQVTPSSLILFEKGNASPIFEFAQDPSVNKSLSQNISIQKTALERTLKDYQTWLSWAGPAQVVSQEIKSEAKDLEKLQTLKIIFNSLEKSHPDASPFPEDQELYGKLAPGVYLSNKNTIMLKKSDGTWGSYAYKGFPQDNSLPLVQANSAMDSFIQDLIVMHLSRPETSPAIKKILLERFTSTEETH
jgi:spermidine synthase